VYDAVGSVVYNAVGSAEYDVVYRVRSAVLVESVVLVVESSYTLLSSMLQTVLDMMFTAMRRSVCLRRLSTRVMPGFGTAEPTKRVAVDTVGINSRIATLLVDDLDVPVLNTR